MQVVYSGGSTTPTPSPRLQRKQMPGYGRPVLPGYLTGPPPVSTHHRSKEEVHKSEGDKSLRDSIPAMSKPLAVMCLIFNIILPGLGTFIAGMSILCCSRLRHKNGSKSNVVWVNSYVALLQFLTTFLFLLGWIWSIMWGVAFLSVAEYYKHKDLEHDKKNHNHHHHHHHHHEHHHHHDNHHQQQHLSKITSIPEDSHTDLVDTDTSNIHSNGTNSSSASHVYNHTHELYVAPAPPANQTQPMIVLQQPPVNHSDKPKNADPLLVARTRHQKIIQRQMSDNQLSPFNLTHQHLEAIVIHDAPIPRLQRTETIDSTNSSTAAESNGVAVST